MLQVLFECTDVTGPIAVEVGIIAATCMAATGSSMLSGYKPLYTYISCHSSHSNTTTNRWMVIEPRCNTNLRWTTIIAAIHVYYAALTQYAIKYRYSSNIHSPSNMTQGPAYKMNTSVTGVEMRWNVCDI